ncbi:winged helix-turn-helix transcriptional regulator [Kaarinaea lacus]
MKSYGQFCPVATAAEVIGERWTPLVIRELVSGSQTFNEIRMGVARMSPSLLSSRLKSLEKAGVIQRVTKGTNVRYELTKAGEELRPVIMALGAWGQRWARSDMSKIHMDPSYLMWDMRRRIEISHFPKRRTVLLFEFSDYTAKQRRWWLVINKGEIDLCRTDPGYDIQLHALGDLRTFTQVWMGDITLQKAVRENKIKITGDSKLKKSMKSWFTLSVVADIKAAN